MHATAVDVTSPKIGVHGQTLNWMIVERKRPTWILARVLVSAPSLPSSTCCLRAYIREPKREPTVRSVTALDFDGNGRHATKREIEMRQAAE